MEAAAVCVDKNIAICLAWTCCIWPIPVVSWFSSLVIFVLSIYSFKYVLILWFTSSTIDTSKASILIIVRIIIIKSSFFFWKCSRMPLVLWQKFLTIWWQPSLFCFWCLNKWIDPASLSWTRQLRTELIDILWFVYSVDSLQSAVTVHVNYHFSILFIL